MILVDYGDNPAQRLWTVLEQAKGYGDRNPTDAWRAIFEVEKNADILPHAGELSHLANATRTRIGDYAEQVDTTLILENFSGVEATIGNFLVLSQMPTMTAFLTPYNATVEYGLRHAISVLHRLEPDVVLTDDQQNDLLSQVHQLIDEVIAAPDLDTDLMAWIVQRLRSVETALLNVRITGTGGITNAVDRIVGSLVRQPSRTARLINHPIWGAIVRFVRTANTVTQAASQMHALATADQHLLEELLGHGTPPALPPSGERSN